MQVLIVKRHEDARHELWYTAAEYDLMKLAVKKDVLKIRAENDADAAFAVACLTLTGDDSSEEDSGFWIGIAHLLTPVCTYEVKACRARCRRAVLAEQARQDPSARLRWEAIALASFAQTRKPILRAMKLGKLHHDSISALMIMIMIMSVGGSCTFKYICSSVRVRVIICSGLKILRDNL
jgi:hypothetical protein